MFAVFGKTRAEEEARRGLVHDKQKGIWKTAEAETLEHAVITWEEM